MKANSGRLTAILFILVLALAFITLPRVGAQEATPDPFVTAVPTPVETVVPAPPAQPGFQFDPQDNTHVYVFIGVLAVVLIVVVLVLHTAIAGLAKSAPPFVVEALQAVVNRVLVQLEQTAKRTATPVDDALIADLKKGINDAIQKGLDERLEPILALSAANKAADVDEIDEAEYEGFVSLIVSKLAGVTLTDDEREMIEEFLDVEL